MNGFDPGPAAQALLEARRTRRWLDALPSRPATDSEAYAVQDAVASALGPVGGWKVGAASPQSEPFRGPIQSDTIFADGARLPAGMLHVVGVEGELAYRFDRDLPPRERPYATEEVLAAVGSLHPVIEILDTRFTAIGSQDALSHRADHMNNGALVVGPALNDWRRVESLRVPVRLILNGELRHEGIGGNSAGDNVRLLVWMANDGTRAAGGIRAGQVITTGSCSGTDWVGPGTEARAEFEGVGAVQASILRADSVE